AHADEAAEHLVLLGDAAQLAERLVLAARRVERQRARRADGRRHAGVDEGVEALEAQVIQHLADVLLPRPEVSRDERIAGVEKLRLRHQGRSGIACGWRWRDLDDDR